MQILLKILKVFLKILMNAYLSLRKIKLYLGKYNQNKMDEIQRIISLKFNQIKGFINESIDKTPKNYG